MDEAQLIEKRKIAVSRLSEIVGAGKTEKRKLSTTEMRSFTETNSEIQEIDEQLANKNHTTQITQSRKMETTTFSLIKAIRSRAKGENLSPENLAIVEVGREEMRKSGLSFSGDIQIPLETRAVIMATSATSGQEVIAEQKLPMLESLQASLVLVQAGATFLNGLVGDVSIPTYAGTTSAWKGEGVDATDGAGATGEVTLTPKRLTTFIDISKQFLAQDSIGAESMLMAEIVKSIQGKLEGTIFGKEAVSATQPGGFFAVAPATLKGTATFANMVALETAVDTANALTTAKYITNAGGRGKLKTTVKVANMPNYIMESDGTINGYPTLVTNNVAKALQVGADEFGVVFGDWSQFVIGQWGAIDLTVDPYTQAGKGNIRVVINAYFDAKPKRAEAFAIASIK